MSSDNKGLRENYVLCIQFSPLDNGFCEQLRALRDRVTIESFGRNWILDTKRARWVKGSETIKGSVYKIVSCYKYGKVFNKGLCENNGV